MGLPLVPSIWFLPPQTAAKSAKSTALALNWHLNSFVKLATTYEHTTFDGSDIRSRNPRFTPEAIRANRVVIDVLERIATHKGATPAQIALAWLLAQKPWIVPIPGSRKLERLEENSGAAEVKLISNDLREIDNAMSQITVVGDRY